MKPIYDPLLGKMRSELTAGAGLDISGGTISTITPPDGVPYVAGDGVYINGATIGADLTGGYRMEIVSGSTISQQRYFPVQVVSGASVTMQAGGFYRINATTSQVTLNAETIPAGSAGLEGHAEIFVAGAGSIKAGANVTLVNSLEPDAVNNCTLRFYNGLCRVSVEDHAAGYIVTVASGTTSGSLYYGLATASNEYISVDATLNGTTLDLGGVTTSAGEKHVVGNGYTETIVSGGINCTSKTTLANLTANGVVVNSGTLTLGDVYIPSGATVTQTDGRIVLEHVSGSGTIDFAGGSGFDRNFGTDALVDGVTITGATTAGIGGAFYFNGGYAGTVNVRNCTISGNMAQFGAVMHNAASASRVTMRFENCLIDGNTTTFGGILYLQGSTVSLSGCTVGAGQTTQLANTESTATDTCLILEGETKLSSYIYGAGSGANVNVVSIQSGAVLDLAGNTGSGGIVIDPGYGNITFAPGGATVYPSAGFASAYILGGMTVPKITNTNEIDLGDTNTRVYSATSAVMENVRITGSKAQAVYIAGGAFTARNCVFSGVVDATAIGGAVYLGVQGSSGGVDAPAILDNCQIVDNRTSYGCGGMIITKRNNVLLSDCLVSGNSVYGGKTFVDLEIQNGGKVDIVGCTIGELGLALGNCTATLAGTNRINLIGYRGSESYVTISSGASINLTSSIAPGGGIVVDGGTCTINGVTVAPTAEGSAYTSIINSGGTLYIDGEPAE